MSADFLDGRSERDERAGVDEIIHQLDVENLIGLERDAGVKNIFEVVDERKVERIRRQLFFVDGIDDAEKIIGGVEGRMNFFLDVGERESIAKFVGFDEIGRDEKIFGLEIYIGDVAIDGRQFF